jgi:outer membrane protein assembly factor BamB
MKSRLLTIIITLCLCFSAVSLSSSSIRAASTSDWPQWRGPQRNGISLETGLLKQWPAEGPKLLWQMNDIGDGYSTPAVVGTRIYLMSNRGMDNEFVQALSTQDGKLIWTTRVGNVGNGSDFLYSKARSTPTVGGFTFGITGHCGPTTSRQTVRHLCRLESNLAVVAVLWLGEYPGLQWKDMDFNQRRQWQSSPPRSVR